MCLYLGTCLDLRGDAVPPSMLDSILKMEQPGGRKKKTYRQMWQLLRGAVKRDEEEINHIILWIFPWYNPVQQEHLKNVKYSRLCKAPLLI